MTKPVVEVDATLAFNTVVVIVCTYFINKTNVIYNVIDFKKINKLFKTLKY